MNKPTTTHKQDNGTPDEPLGSLGLAAGSALWVMLSNHPFYPSIEYFATEAEAMAAAREEIKEMHRKGAHYTESTVSVAMVTAHAQIHTEY